MLLFAAVFIMGACETNTVYHSYQHISDKGWAKNDTLLFSFPITDSVPNYKFYIEVRNNEGYPYQDIFLFVKRRNTTSSSFITDTVKCILSDEQGKWRGTGLGALYQSVYPYIIVPYSQVGSDTLRISHGMRDDLLRGINDIGILIEKK